VSTLHSINGLKTFKFGDSAELADRLAALVVAGVKTGTCSAAAHGVDVEVGERQICLSGDDVPVCEIETVALRILRFDDVTPEMAALEGEGDLSYRYWWEAHEAYFKRERTWKPDMDVVFETFRMTCKLDDTFASRSNEMVKAERSEAFANGYDALGAPQ